MGIRTWRYLRLLVFNVIRDRLYLQPEVTSCGCGRGLASTFFDFCNLRFGPLRLQASITSCRLSTVKLWHRNRGIRRRLRRKLRGDGIQFRTLLKVRIIRRTRRFSRRVYL